MMKNIILLVLLGVALIAAFKPVLDDAPIKAQFEEFQKKYNKVYTSDEERTLRYKNFKESLIRSSKRNAASPKATFGITKFSDLSEEEFQNTVLMRNKITPSKPVGVKKNTLITPPESFDWRDKGAVTAVKNQEQCGSCWAFSTTENVESMWILAGKADDTIALSPQQIVDCDTGDDGCGGGEPTNAYAYLMGAGGLESESDYPYVGEDDGNCSFNSKDIVASISNWVYATEWLDETTLQQSLLTMGPLSVCVDASSWQDYQNGIMTWSECAYINFLDHCVQLVGYNSTDTNNQYWMVRNSWADDWGVDGYIWLQMWEDTCGITYEATCSQI